MKLYKVILSIYVIFLVCGCQKNPVIHKIHMDVLENHKDTIELVDYTNFDWDRALLYNDYVICVNRRNRDSIEKALHFNLNKLPLRSYEFVAPLIFLKDDRIVHVEVNKEETFPNSKRRKNKEKIWIDHPKEEIPLIEEILRTDSRFETSVEGYQKHHTVRLKIIP